MLIGLDSSCVLAGQPVQPYALCRLAVVSERASVKHREVTLCEHLFVEIQALEICAAARLTFSFITSIRHDFPFYINSDLEPLLYTNTLPKVNATFK